jgi:uncharacterized membrane protein YdjX (TVP38/TMEM64 family)
VTPWIRWVVFGLLVVGIALAYILLPLKDWLIAIADELQKLGPIAILAYVATYIVASLLLLPAALLSIGAGVTWGAVGGAAIAVPSTTLAASAAFIIARYFFSGRFRAWLLNKPRLSAVEQAVNDKGAALVFLLRLSPMLPFPILNYIFGLTRVPFQRFAVATFFGMIPVTSMWAYVGAIGGKLGRGNESVGTAEIIAGVVGGLITLGVTVWVGKAARKAMREAAAHRTQGAV